MIVQTELCGLTDFVVKKFHCIVLPTLLYKYINLKMKKNYTAIYKTWSMDHSILILISI